MVRLLLLSALVVLTSTGCAVSRQSVTAKTVELDLRGIEKICVEAHSEGFHRVVAKQLLADGVPHSVVFSGDTNECSLILRSDAVIANDIGDFVRVYELSAYQGKRLVGRSSVEQPNNTDLGKFNSDDLVKKAVAALKLDGDKIGSQDIETYNIDVTRLTTLASRGRCGSGEIETIVVEGSIGPDSAFAVDALLARSKPCSGNKINISLRSGGGFLVDGYAMGETFRKYSVKTIVEDSEICASSCAVAFLGGAMRTISDGGKIMFHAPYFSGKNEYGERDINCDVGDEALSDLKNYYSSMTDKETGERLFERTMWYCSADDGWVVTGGAAAELYGIATER